MNTCSGMGDHFTVNQNAKVNTLLKWNIFFSKNEKKNAVLINSNHKKIIQEKNFPPWTWTGPNVE